MKFKLLFIMCLMSFCALAQEDDIPVKTYKVSITRKDLIIECEHLTKSTIKLALKNDRIYHWYTANEIHESQGEYSGKLLQGKYTSFYLSHNIKEKGDFVNGLKNGEWKNWYENGKLCGIDNWKEGLRDGKSLLFNEEGVLLKEVNYQKDLMHGWYKEYANCKAVTVKKYRKGQEVLPKQPKVKKAKTQAVKTDSIAAVKTNKELTPASDSSGFSKKVKKWFAPKAKSPADSAKAMAKPAEKKTKQEKEPASDKSYKVKKV